MSLISTLYVVLSLLFILSGCVPHINHHGKLLEKESLNKIKTSHYTKDEVLALIGSPSSIAAFDNNTWIYYYKITKSVSFFGPEPLEHHLIKIEFDSNGRVKEVLLANNPELDIVPNENITPSVDQDRPFLHQIFSNFGRAARKEDSKTGK